MCLAVPAKIISIDKDHAIVDMFNVKQKVNIQLVNNPEPGDFVLIHAGFAIDKIDSDYYNFLWENLYKMSDKGEWF